MYVNHDSAGKSLKIDNSKIKYMLDAQLFYPLMEKVAHQTWNQNWNEYKSNKNCKNVGMCNECVALRNHALSD